MCPARPGLRLRRRRALGSAGGVGIKHRVRIVSPFVASWHPRLPVILARHREVTGTHREFVDVLLASAGDLSPTARSAPSERLTEREEAVLAYLPTMRSNAEIAEALGISVNTVKHHLKSVHRKLGVASRREAVGVARELGLLPTAIEPD